MTRGIQVPVTIGFDRHRAIGTLRVDADLLPEGENFVFAVKGQINHREKTKKFELLEVSVLSDAEFMEYLDAQTKPKKGGK